MVDRLKAIGPLVFASTELASVEPMIRRAHATCFTDSPLTELRFDLIEDGLDKEYFHASEDEQATRNKLFEIIARGEIRHAYFSLMYRGAQVNCGIDPARSTAAN